MVEKWRKLVPHVTTVCFIKIYQKNDETTKHETTTTTSTTKERRNSKTSTHEIKKGIGNNNDTAILQKMTHVWDHDLNKCVSKTQSKKKAELEFEERSREKIG